jgi:nitric oxide reductase activation protein
VLPHLLQLRRAIARTRTRTDAISHGKSTGQLDRRKLHSLAFGNRYVFQRKTEKTPGLALALLVDESGSMRGPKVETARQVAILFHAALASQPEIDLFIYGHSADDPSRTTNLFSYCAPRQRARRYSLGAIQSRRNNRDGVAIAAVAREVIRQTRHRRIVLIVISDGAPQADGYSGNAALEHTRDVVRSLGAVRVVHVAIDQSAGGHCLCDDAFSFTSLAELPGQMSGLLERLLTEA